MNGKLGMLTVVAVLAAMATGCSSYVKGGFHSEGAMTGDWHLTPNTCVSAFHRGVPGVEIFRRSAPDDTEIVLLDTHEEGVHVLVRVPGSNRMIRLTHEDCRVFEPKMDFNGATVNGAPGVLGSIRLDCDVLGVGHVHGGAAFNCY
jgi:hypothetical protein